MPTAKNIFKYRISNEVKIRTRKLMDKFSKNSSSKAIRGNSNWIGWLGRVAVMDFFEKKGIEVELFKEKEEFFLKIGNEFYQVKTAARNIHDDPDEEWSCLVELKNWEKWVDHDSRLFFSYYYEKYGLIWFLGYMEREQFYKKAKIYKEGEKFEKMIVKEDLISTKLGKIIKFRNLLFELGVLKKAKIEVVLPKLKNIYRKYSRRIYEKRGDVNDYALFKTLGQDPSEFKTNSEHLKAARQYADLIRKEIGNSDISDDDIIPAGTIATYIKADGKGVVLPIEIANAKNISNSEYQKLLWGCMRQILELFDLKRADLEYDGKLKQKKVEQYC